MLRAGGPDRPGHRHGDARRRAAGTPASTTVLTSAEVLTSAAGAMDDLLRYTPGFSLFRRSSSRTANPTTQGVTLRGVSGSGASRTLVLTDGVPLNDPFGSWVYWNRVPQAAIDRVEVLRGTTGDLYGAEALGGVVQLLTFTPGAPRRAGVPRRRIARHGPRVALRRRQPRRLVALRLGRGRDDRRRLHRGRGSARSRSIPAPTATTVPASSTSAGTATRRGPTCAASGFREERGNGTPIQVNDTTWRQGALTGGGAVAAAPGRRRCRTAARTTSRPSAPWSPIASSERLPMEQTHAQRLHTGVGAVGRRRRAPLLHRRRRAPATPRPRSKSSATR